MLPLKEDIICLAKPGFAEVDHIMILSDILCPYCKNSHLGEIRLPPQYKNSPRGDDAKTEKIRLLYVCLSCTKMINEEELNT